MWSVWKTATGEPGARLPHRMKTPPGQRDTPVRAIPVAQGEHDRRFLVFAGIVLVAVALGFKSELLTANQVWVLGLGACPTSKNPGNGSPPDGGMGSSTVA